MRIKWPNDVYGVGLKLGGVLCQSAYRGGRFQVVVGVGLNLANRAPTTCVDALIDARHRSWACPARRGPSTGGGRMSATHPLRLLGSAMPFACARYCVCMPTTSA